MFDFLKNKGNPPADIKEIRQQILLFIKEQLKKAEGGEGASIKGLQLYIAAGEEEHLYESALYTNEPGRFRNEEVQRIADDFAIDLPSGWSFETIFVNELPAGLMKASNMPVALSIVTRKHTSVKKPEGAVLKVLSGQAEQEFYEITPSSGRIYIGRDKHVQDASGFIRDNDIAFPSEAGNDGNKYVSRQHAHIEWDKASHGFCLYADEGGIPPRNKLKVQRANGETVRLQTTEIAHRLEPGDRIVLGTSVLLEFDYKSAVED
jgi:hypothetical protein